MTFREWLDGHIEEIRRARDSHPRTSEEWGVRDAQLETATEIRLMYDAYSPGFYGTPQTTDGGSVR